VSYFINLFKSQTPENKEEDPDVPEAVDEGDIQMEHSLISSTAQVWEQ